MRILVFDNDPEWRARLRNWIEMRPAHHGQFFSTVNAAESIIANSHASNDHFDAVIIEIGTGYLQGLDLIRRMRKRHDTTPAIVTSTERGVHLQLDAYGAGVDDFLLKPVDERVLEAKIIAIMRRSNRWVSATPSVGLLTFNPATRAFTARGEEVHFTPIEREIMERLFRNANQFHTRDQLCGAMSSTASVSSIEMHISRIRKKINSIDLEIKAVYGQGYKLEVVAPQTINFFD